MPWFQWWEPSREPGELPTIDGVPRWNSYIDANTGRITLPLPQFMLDEPRDVNYVIEELKFGPYAFSRDILGD